MARLIERSGKTKLGKPKKQFVRSAAEKHELKRIGKGISALITRSGITIERFAYENDLGKGHLSRIIRGDSDVRYTTLRVISKGLGFKSIAAFLTNLLEM